MHLHGGVDLPKTFVYSASFMKSSLYEFDTDEGDCR